MRKVVLLKQAEEKPEAGVLVLFVLPFCTGCLVDRQHKGRQGQATERVMDHSDIDILFAT